MTTEEASKKELEKFKKEYQKLMSKYPKVMVTCNTNGELIALHTMTYNTKVFI